MTAPYAPLKGLKVVELARILAGPWAGQTLADLGARVIKVERPPQGDDTRQWGPPFVRDAGGNNTGSAYYHCCNRGKEIVWADFQTQEGRALILDLVKDADILIENFKVGGLKPYGLDYESLTTINPRLIYCSITGFGQHGPYAARPGYDFMIQAMSGAMSVTGEAAGPPMKAGYATADLFTAFYAVAGLLAAVHERAQTGKGAWLDLALLDCQMAALINQAANYLVSGTVPQRRGNAHPNIVPYDLFETGNGPIIIATGSDRQYADLCQLLNAPQLRDDPRYATNAGRVEHRAALVPALNALTRLWDKHELLEALARATIPAGPINTIEEAFADEHVKARGIRDDSTQPPSVRFPVRRL